MMGALHYTLVRAHPSIHSLSLYSYVGLRSEGLQNTLALLPLVGPVAYLMLRPKLPEEEA